MILKRYPYRPRREHERPDPGYGVGYRPDWPSILSVAHDTADGGAVFVVTDRPCVIVPGPMTLPLSVAGLAVVAAVEVLPVKFRVAMSAAVPAGAAWTWGSGACTLVDPVTNHAPNPAAGVCADVPGPYPPPAPLVLVAAEYEPNEGEAWTRLTFDRPIDITTLDAAAIRIDHGSPIDTRWRGVGPGTLVTPTMVQVTLVAAGAFAGTGVTLDAGADSGIVADDDGGTWAGVEGLALPYP